MSPEEIIAREFHGTYGVNALGQARTCANLAHAMRDWASTSIWNKVIVILSERAALPLAQQH